MINIPRDMFIRLAISAKKFKNREDKQVLTKLGNNLSKLEQMDYSETKFAGSGPIISAKTEKIEDTVVRMTENSQIAELKNDIENVETLWHKIKTTIHDTSIISRIDNKIHDLRRMIYQKSYV